MLAARPMCYRTHPPTPARPDDRFRSRMLYALRFYDVLSSLPLVDKMHGRRARDTTGILFRAPMSFLVPSGLFCHRLRARIAGRHASSWSGC